MAANTTTIYVLELSEGKYYVGKTQDIEQRICQHLTANSNAVNPSRNLSCAFVQKYRPIRGFTSKEGCDGDEDATTLEMMAAHGIDNVRGGAFCEMNLSEETKKVIQKMIHSRQNCCYTCGETGHFAKDCEFVVTEPAAKAHGRESKSCPSDTKCARCGRDGHETATCYAKKHINGDALPLFCTRCGRTKHSASDCYAKKHIDGYILADGVDIAVSAVATAVTNWWRGGS